MVIKSQLQLPFLQRTAAVGDQNNGFHHTGEHIPDQADQTSQGQNKADHTKNVHGPDQAVHMGHTVFVQYCSPLHYFIQKPHQGR